MPTRFRDLSDTNLQNLSSSNNKNLVKFNSTTNKFDIVNADSVIGTGITSISPEFIDVIEKKVNVENISFSSLDGGNF